MSPPTTQTKKARQLSLEEYNKIKEKRAKSKLKLHFPWPIKLVIAVPFFYCLFLIVYYLTYIRWAAER